MLLGGLFLAFEVIWIGSVLRRLPEDIAEFRRPPDPMDRVVHGFYWVVTAVFIVHLGWLAWSLARPTLAFFYPELRH